MTDIVSFYSDNARQLAAQYDGLTFEQVHSCWLPLLEARQPGLALDIGAGSGRDAAALSKRGWSLTAIEPAQGLRLAGQQKDSTVRWIDSRLPELDGLQSDHHFDLILLSAVWMHLTALERSAALKRLQQLLRPEGMIVVSLRHGPSEPERPMYPVSVEEIKALSTGYGLTVELMEEKSQDCLQRQQVHWQTVVLKYRK